MIQRAKVKGKYRNRKGERFIWIKQALIEECEERPKDVWRKRDERGREQKENSDVMVEVMMNTFICISVLLKYYSFRLRFDFHVKYNSPP